METKLKKILGKERDNQLIKEMSDLIENDKRGYVTAQTLLEYARKYFASR